MVRVFVSYSPTPVHRATSQTTNHLTLIVLPATLHMDIEMMVRHVHLSLILVRLDLRMMVMDHVFLYISIVRMDI